MRRWMAMISLAAVSATVLTTGSAGAGTDAATATSPGSRGTGATGPAVTVDLAGTVPQSIIRGPQANSVIGPDQRVKVSQPHLYPGRSIVLVTFESFGSSSRCSGWMAGPSSVVTAGHCVAPGFGGTYYPVGSYRVYPAARGGDFGNVLAPFGECRAVRLDAPQAWLVGQAEYADYGVITLDCDVGRRTGWLGFQATSGDLSGAITVQGYPGDKWFNQWYATDVVRASDSRRVYYAADTVGGMSGSPVVRSTAGCTNCVIAIHAYGLYGSGPTARYNHGTRISPAVFRNLRAWIG